MICTVVWDPDAENELADLWVHSPVQRAITDAANRIDALLRVDPHLQGTNLSGSRRILFEPPLAVIFEVSIPDRLVRVLAVLYVPTNGAP
jgi:hypothetical protein